MSVLPIEPVPQTLLDAIARTARERFGGHDLDGASLARAVRQVSEAYTRVSGSPAQVAGDRDALCARLKFFLARDFPKVQAPLAELASVSAFPSARELRVLDLGAGLGTSGLAAAGFALTQAGTARVRIDALDRDAQALDIAARLSALWSASAGHAIELRTQRVPLARAALTSLRGAYDLIVVGFVLNELAEQGEGASEAERVEAHHALLRSLAGLLSEDGALIVLEPALRETSRALQRVRSLFAAEGGPPFVFAPCVQRGDCPLLVRERDWCHEQLPLALPVPLVAVARAAGLRTSDLSYSYLTLTRADRSLAELDPERRGYRVVSSPLRSKGKVELLLCGPGAPRRMQRLDRALSPNNAALDGAGRGCIVHWPTEGAQETELLRVGAATQITALQRVADSASGL
jgi:ribosomal protein RSM22 (predicted rRNA methylase)